MGGLFTAGEEKAPGLFVYGSLMEGFFNYDKVLAGKVRSRKRSWIRGKLFHQSAKGYPALIPGDSRVAGEFLELEDFDCVLKTCDEIENYFGPGRGENEYERRITAIEPEGAVSAAFAYVYWYARKDLETTANPAVFLPAGDWRRYMVLREGNGILRGMGTGE